MISALQNTIGQGVKLDSVDLTLNGDYESTYKDGIGVIIRPFLLDLPSNSVMKVQFMDDTIGIFNFKTGTSPAVKIKKVFDVGSVLKQFQVIY